MNEYFLIAKIISAAGKDGYVKISSFSDFPERFFNLTKVYIDFFDDKKEFFVEDVKKQKENFLLKLKNFETEKEAGVLIGKEIFVDDKSAVVLPEDYFFIHDLLGSTVLRNGEEFGIIKDVLVCPANDVYVIEKDGREILIPAVKDYIESFDPVKKIMTFKPGKDFYDDDED